MNKHNLFNKKTLKIQSSLSQPNLSESGFTLIELLITVSIVSILALVAMSTLTNYKKNGFNTMAKMDLKTAITAEEAYYTDNQTYVACPDALGCEAVLSGFRSSKNGDGTPAVTSFNFVGDDSDFTGTASHPKGNLTFTFESSDSEFNQF